MNNLERIKNMNIDEMANFLRDDILYHLPCQGVCEAQEECPFACLKMVKEWLNSEVQKNYKRKDL